MFIFYDMQKRFRSFCCYNTVELTNFAVQRRVTCRPRWWSVCSWSSPMLSPSKRRSQQRSVPRSQNTTQVRGATREQSSFTKKLLCIARQISRSAELNRNHCVYLLQLWSTSIGIFWSLLPECHAFSNLFGFEQNVRFALLTQRLLWHWLHSDECSPVRRWWWSWHGYTSPLMRRMLARSNAVSF